MIELHWKGVEVVDQAQLMDEKNLGQESVVRALLGQECLAHSEVGHRHSRMADRHSGPAIFPLVPAWSMQESRRVMREAQTRRSSKAFVCVHPLGVCHSVHPDQVDSKQLRLAPQAL